MAGKRPRQIQRTTSMSQLGGASFRFSHARNGDAGVSLRGRSCPPQQESESSPEAGEMAGLPAHMEEHANGMAIDSNAEESSIACRTPRGGGANTVSPHLRVAMAGLSRSVRPAHFLEICYLCSKFLGYGQDVFIYRGDRAFCSAECRHLQMMADERREKVSLTGASGGPVTTVQVSDVPNANHAGAVVAA